MVNANFETGPFTTVGTVSGWTLTGNVADNAQGATSGTHAAALSAGTNSQGDTLSQSFATTVGANYNVDFDSGIYGKRNGQALQVRVQLLGNGTLIDQTITPPDARTTTASAVQFQHYRFSFTANSATTTLRFTSVGLGNTNADEMIDTVAVSVVSTP